MPNIYSILNNHSTTPQLYSLSEPEEGYSDVLKISICQLITICITMSNCNHRFFVIHACLYFRLSIFLNKFKTFCYFLMYQYCIFPGQGYMKAYPYERAMRDARILLIFEVIYRSEFDLVKFRETADSSTY